jgi:hypothetical protein
MKSRGINKGHRSKASTGAIHSTAGGHRRRDMFYLTPPRHISTLHFSDLAPCLT